MSTYYGQPVLTGLPRYDYLMREAFEASEAVDMFDVRDDVPGSLAHFKELLIESAKADRKLVGFISENANELYESFNARIHS